MSRIDFYHTERDKGCRTVTRLCKRIRKSVNVYAAEYQSMIEDYQNNEVSYDDLTKQDKIAEIQGLEQRITTFQQSIKVHYKIKK